MPVLSGLDAATRISGLGLTSQILIFTMHESGELAHDARRVGARGYVTKSDAARHLVRAIETLLSGGTFFGGPEKRESGEKDPGSGILFRSPCLEKNKEISHSRWRDRRDAGAAKIDAPQCVNVGWVGCRFGALDFQGSLGLLSFMNSGGASVFLRRLLILLSSQKIKMRRIAITNSKNWMFICF